MDDFPGSDPGEVWDPGASGGATVIETGGELVVTLPSGSAGGSDASFTTTRYYDLRGDSISVEVTSAGNTATTAEAYFAVEDGTGQYLEIQQQKGTIRFVRYVGGTWTSLKSSPYSATNHKYWRFREDGVNTYWETGSDGVTWAIQAQAQTASLFPMSFVQIEIGGSTDGGEVSPGSVHFDKVNGGGPATQKWCDIASITDDFNTATQSLAWKRSFTNSPETVAQVGGQLVFTLAVNDTAYGSYYSSAAYDLTGSAILLQVPQTANTATTGETYLSLHGPGNNELIMIEEKGQLYAKISLGGSDQDIGSVLYVPAQHAWWRIRESGGTIFWETAPDGKAWTVQTQLAKPFAIDVLEVEIGSGTYQSLASPGASHFDNLNLPPP